jgi:hypothetical protein
MLPKLFFSFALLFSTLGINSALAQSLSLEESKASNQIQILMESNDRLQKTLDQTNATNQQQVKALAQNLTAIQKRLNNLETRSLGPVATPVQLEANAGVIQDLQFKTKTLIEKFEENNKSLKLIIEEKNLNPDMVRFYLVYSQEQQKIKTQLLELEKNLRSFDSGIIFPVLEPLQAGPLESLTGFAKFKAEILKQLSSEIESLTTQFAALSSNQYFLADPTDDEQKAYMAIWGINMKDSVNQKATRQYHQKIVKQYSKSIQQLAAFKSKYSQAGFMGVGDSSIGYKISELEEVKIFGKTSPEDIAKLIETQYQPTNKIEIDTSHEDMMFWFLVALSIFGATAISITLWKVYTVTNEKTKQ